MKVSLFIVTIIMVPMVMLYSDDSDWGDDNFAEEVAKDDNSAFQKTKIKNRSKRTYEDKIYKYITGDYNVENNKIELATIHLNDRSKNDDIEINIITEDLRVEGDSYKDSIDIKRNKYKNFVQNDEQGVEFFAEDEEFSELGDNVRLEDSRYNKVPDEDVSELETIDLREKDDIREVNVFMEDVNIRVD